MPIEVKSPSHSIGVTSHAHVTSLGVFLICISVLEFATSEPHIGTVKIIVYNRIRETIKCEKEVQTDIYVQNCGNTVCMIASQPMPSEV